MDSAHKKTDKEIGKLERKFKGHYQRAGKTLEADYKEYLSSKEYKAIEAEYNNLLALAEKGGQKEAKELDRFVRINMQKKRRYKNMIDNMARATTQANIEAAAMVNERTFETFALHHNFEAAKIKKASGVSFDLYSKDTVENLIKKEPDLLPMRKVKKAKDTAWNYKKLNNEITQAILTGEPVPKTAKRLEDVMGMNKSAATRNARTSLTSAQNAGRNETYKEAKKMGLKIEVEWIATKDSRTRDSHRAVDRERIKQGDTFSNGLRFPGDPMGDPAEIYGCRCTTRAVIM